MPAPVRLRQVALVARDLDGVAAQLAADLGLTDPFNDKEIISFGLENAVFAVGDTFLELVSPLEPGTTAGRYLERRGGDAGYMAIFQFADKAELATARGRLADLDVRVVWQADLADISGTHLHPKDVPGAIVSLDAADPRESWRWAGPSWTGGAPPHEPGGISRLTVAATDPAAVAARWAAVLGLAADGTGLTLDGGRQSIRFVAAPDTASEGIVGLGIATTRGAGSYEVCGVRVDLEAAR